jgi:hypothetical protein
MRTLWFREPDLLTIHPRPISFAGLLMILPGLGFGLGKLLKK